MDNDLTMYAAPFLNISDSLQASLQMVIWPLSIVFSGSVTYFKGYWLVTFLVVPLQMLFYTLIHIVITNGCVPFLQTMTPGCRDRFIQGLVGMSYSRCLPRITMYKLHPLGSKPKALHFHTPYSLNSSEGKFHLFVKSFLTSLSVESFEATRFESDDQVLTAVLADGWEANIQL